MPEIEQGSRPVQKSRWKALVVILTLGLLIAGGFAIVKNYGRGNGAGETAQNAKSHQTSATSKLAPVHVAVAEQRDVPVVLNGLGTVQAWNAVSVKSRVDGQIEKLFFEEGQVVKEGEVLLQLDSRSFVAATDQAKAKVAQDQASLGSANADLGRTTALNKQGFATRQLFDQQTASVLQLTSQVEADNAALQNADVQLKYTTIRSPISGRVGLRNVDVGNIVRASDQAGVVTVTQMDPIAVVFTAPEGEVGNLNDGIRHAPLHVSAYSSDGKTLLGEGTLALVDNQVDQASGSIRLKAKFENSQNALWPGLSVSTRLTVKMLSNVTVIPDAAVQRGPNGLFAYVVDEKKKAELRQLKIGQIQDGQAVVLAGVRAGETVVTAGQYKVQAGGELQILDSPTQQRTALKPNEKVVD